MLCLKVDDHPVLKQLYCRQYKMTKNAMSRSSWALEAPERLYADVEAVEARRPKTTLDTTVNTVQSKSERIRAKGYALFTVYRRNALKKACKILEGAGVDVAE